MEMAVCESWLDHDMGLSARREGGGVGRGRRWANERLGLETCSVGHQNKALPYIHVFAMQIIEECGAEHGIHTVQQYSLSHCKDRQTC